MHPCDILGGNIKKYRLARNMSQEHLAFYAGTTGSQISRMERGLGNPELITIWNIADALKVGADLLLKEEEQYDGTDGQPDAPLAGGL